jgi:hypothetical protein
VCRNCRDIGTHFICHPIDSKGRTTWIEDAHRDDGKQLVIRACGELVKINHIRGETRQINQMSIAFGSLKVAALLTNNIYLLACGFLQPPLAKFKRSGSTTL